MSDAAEAEVRTILTEDLRILDALVEVTLEEARGSVAASTGDAEERQRAEGWLVAYERSARAALGKRDPGAALLDVWALDRRTEEFLAAPEGRTTLGGRLEIVTKAIDPLHEAIDRVVREYIQPSDRETAEKQLSVYVASHPVRPPTSRVRRLLDPFGFGKEVFGAVSGLASLPLAPGRAISSLKRGANELGKFNDTAKSFTNVVRELPTRTREELEKLLAGADDKLTTVSQSIRDARDTARAIKEAMATADNLTSGVKDVIVTAGGTIQSAGEAADHFTRTAQAIGEAAGSLAEAAKSISGSVSDSAGSVKGTTTDLRQTAESISRAAKSIADATESSRRLVQSFKEARARDGPVGGSLVGGNAMTGGAGAGAPGGERHGFDPREYHAAAQSIEEGANAVANMLREIQAIQAHNDEVREKKKLEALADRAAGGARAPAADVAIVPADRSFQPLDYKVAADAIGVASADVRGTLQKVEDLVDSGKLQTGAKSMRATLEPFVVSAMGQAEAITDYVIARVALLILMIFVLAVLFTVFKRRLPPRPKE